MDANTTSKFDAAQLTLEPPPGGHLSKKPPVRGSGSYPSMIRCRTAAVNKRVPNKIRKRRSDSYVIISGSVGAGGSSEALNHSSRHPSDHRLQGHKVAPKKTRRQHKKRTAYNKANRRKSLENLGLVVRNRCGTPKLQWPTDRKESDLFDLIPEGCLQVRQLTNQKSSGAPFRRSCNGDFALSHPDEDTKKKDTQKTNTASGNSSSTSVPTKTDWKAKRNISVIVRIRPKQSRELDEKSIVFRTDAKTIVFDPKEKTKDFYFQGVKQITRNDFGRKRPNRNVSFHFDKVYGPEASNSQIFQEMLQDLTDHLIEGYNSTVFAYGATGSGKTYTMIGSTANPGLTVLMVESLYRKLEQISGTFSYEILCSYLEVYNETIKDLLRPERELSIREDGKKGIIIPELSYYKPRGPSELLKLLRSGNRARTQHATDLNSESSRSHAVFEVRISLKRKTDEQPFTPEDDVDLGRVEVIRSKLVMVDLAGSERGTSISAGLGVPTASSSNTNTASGFFDGGARQREGASINKSLLALANCISALADGKCHIPFRNSKLTRLLKDALSGNCTTLMIANISPSAITSEDTYNTLKYAKRAKSIVGHGQKQRNVFLEDLIHDEEAKSHVTDLEQKVAQLTELLEEERLKNRLLHEFKANNVTDTDPGASGDGPSISKPESNNFSEDDLPPVVEKYLDLIKERVNLFGDYILFAGESRLADWRIAGRKLKVDMGDFLGRLAVSHEHFLEFAKLKNEVGKENQEMSNGSCNYQCSGEETHRRYAKALKDLTEKLENVRQECLTLSSDDSSPVNVEIPLEKYLQLKRLESEQSGNEKVGHFYHHWSEQITNQLVTSGMTMVQCLKVIKSFFEGIETPLGIAQSQKFQELHCKELFDFIYGSAGERDGDTDWRNSSEASIGRKNKILEDLSNLRKLVERPLLIQLTSLLENEKSEAQQEKQQQNENVSTPRETTFVGHPDTSSISNTNDNDMKHSSPQEKFVTEVERFDYSWITSLFPDSSAPPTATVPPPPPPSDSFYNDPPDVEVANPKPSKKEDAAQFTFRRQDHSHHQNHSLSEKDHHDKTTRRSSTNSIIPPPLPSNSASAGFCWRDKFHHSTASSTPPECTMSQTNHFPQNSLPASSSGEKEKKTKVSSSNLAPAPAKAIALNASKAWIDLTTAAIQTAFASSSHLSKDLNKEKEKEVCRRSGAAGEDCCIENESEDHENDNDDNDQLECIHIHHSQHHSNSSINVSRCATRLGHSTSISNPKTFTVSRESLPWPNIPVISSPPTESTTGDKPFLNFPIPPVLAGQNNSRDNAKTVENPYRMKTATTSHRQHLLEKSQQQQQQTFRYFPQELPMTGTGNHETSLKPPVAHKQNETHSHSPKNEEQDEEEESESESEDSETGSSDDSEISTGSFTG